MYNFASLLRYLKCWIEQRRERMLWKSNNKANNPEHLMKNIQVSHLEQTSPPAPLPKERGAGTRTSAQATLSPFGEGLGGEVYAIRYFVDFHLIAKISNS
jgi:hypothetical protein